VLIVSAGEVGRSPESKRDDPSFHNWTTKLYCPGRQEAGFVRVAVGSVPHEIAGKEGREVLTKLRRTKTGFRAPAPARAAAGAGRVAPAQAPLGIALALSVLLGVGCFAVVTAAVVLVVQPTEILGGPLTQRQDAETALYLAGFFVILPLALIAGPRIADAIASGTSREGLSFVIAALVAAMSVAVITARVLPWESAADSLAAFAVWWVVAAAALARATRPAPWELLLRHARLAPQAWFAAAVLGLASLLAFTSLHTIDLLTLLVGAAVAIAILAAFRRGLEAHLPKPRGPWGLALDAAVVVLLALVIPDLVIFRPDAGGFETYRASIIGFHQDFLLGPANQVLAGDAVLVNTASQYGVLPIYLLAGWFKLVPIGYGTTGFLDGVLYVFLFVAGFCVLRLCGTSRLLSAGAMAFALVVLLYNLVYPVGALLQHGPLRFGIPMGVVLGAVIEVREPRLERLGAGIQILLLGLSAIWALETFAFTVATLAALLAFQTWIRSPSERRHWLLRRVALGLAACVTAQALLAAATVVFAGQLPDWGQYGAYMNELLLGKLGDITYDFSRWSPGIPVGVAYAASAAAVVLVARRRRDLAVREKVAFTGLAGTTVYGIALFLYFDNRSATGILPYVSFPAVLAGTLWLSLLLRGALSESRAARLGGLALALSTALLPFAVAGSSFGARFSDTALAYLAPGGESLSSALHRLWHPPPLDPRAPAGQAMLDRFMPGQRRVLILASSNLQSEILIRSERANALPFDDPFEDSFVGTPSRPTMSRSVAELRPGDRLLLQETGLRVLAAFERQPFPDVLRRLPEFPDALTLEQAWILRLIGERFTLRIIGRDPQGFVVASLEPK
jgi:hypothetical protein